MKINSNTGKIIQKLFYINYHITNVKLIWEYSKLFWVFRKRPGFKIFSSSPRWSRGNVLASRSNVRGFKPDWARWVFCQNVKNLSPIPPGGTLSWGSRVIEISGSLKNLKPEKISLLVKFNRHIHVLIPKFGGVQ